MEAKGALAEVLAICEINAGAYVFEPALLFSILRAVRPDTPHPYSVPGGMKGVWICGLAATFWVLLATIGQVWPGFGVNWLDFGADVKTKVVEFSR